MDRSYTVAEIDALRAAVRSKYRVGVTYIHTPEVSGWFGRSRAYDASGRPHPEEREREAAVDAADAAVTEQYLRTHMLAGHTADDLLASEPQLEGKTLTNPEDRK